jgi:hypothetical protein
MDQFACNYNPDANWGYEVNGEAIACLGIPDGDCDCDGNKLDCAGVCGGTAVVDTCGICAGGNTGLIADDDLDDCGVCFGPGIPVGDCDCDGNGLDECGVCGGDNSDCSGCTSDSAVNYNADALVDDGSCADYEYGSIIIDLCPGDDPITLVLTGEHNIAPMTYSTTFQDNLIESDYLLGSALSESGTVVTLSAQALSNWGTTTYWGCTEHPSGRITVTCDQPDPYAPVAPPVEQDTADDIASPVECSTDMEATAYQAAGCCDC